MIETIYNSENQEEENIKLPKNIHQIGSGETKYHIYIESKVTEFLKLLPENDKDIRYGVLLGNVKFSKGEAYIFIRSVAEVREVLDNILLFGDDVWTGLYDDIKKYYQGVKIVGWYASLEDFQQRDLFQMRKIHLDHFAGNDKVFLNINREEMELDFYAYLGGDLQKVQCYHIYYEKNPDFESYIFDTHYHLNSKRKSIQTKAENVASEKKEKQEGEEEQKQETIELEQEEKNRDIAKAKGTPLFFHKIASYVAVGALVFTVGVMYRQGQFENLKTEMQEVVANIMNKGEMTDLDDVMLFDETKESTEESVTTEEVNPETEEISTTEQPQETQEQTTEETTTEPQTASVAPAETKYYEVQKGDTLYGICKKLYGNTNNLEMIMELNQLSSPDNISYGKTLIIP